MGSVSLVSAQNVNRRVSGNAAIVRDRPGIHKIGTFVGLGFGRHALPALRNQASSFRGLRRMHFTRTGAAKSPVPLPLSSRISPPRAPHTRGTPAHKDSPK